MDFNLTPEAKLAEKDLRLYRKLQIALYLCAFFTASFLSFKILFPSSYFEFTFANPSAKSNTITQPTDAEGEKLKKGKFTAENNTRFDASVTGVFSKALVIFSLDEKSDPLADNQPLSVRKSYSAFLYPEGSALGFKDGTLLRNKDSFFLVSHGEMRKFASAEVVSRFGFKPEAFIEASEEELSYNQGGRIISANEGYPDHSIFKIKDTYYLLQDSQLKKFTSENAYLSQYRSAQAIEKNEDFFSKYEISPEPIGFADGSLISYGDSIYVVDGKKIFPLADPITFIAKGYSWDDVISAGADEVSLYEKARLFTLSSPHPQGTIFATTEKNKHYIITDGKKHLLPSKNIIDSWLHNRPIAVSEKSIAVENHCQFKKIFWSVRSYSCEMPIENMRDLMGSDYMFHLAPSSTIQADTISIEFKKEIGFSNLRFTLGEIFNRIKNNYAR